MKKSCVTLSLVLLALVAGPACVQAAVNTSVGQASSEVLSSEDPKSKNAEFAGGYSDYKTLKLDLAKFLRESGYVVSKKKKINTWVMNNIEFSVGDMFKHQGKKLSSEAVAFCEAMREFIDNKDKKPMEAWLKENNL